MAIEGSILMSPTQNLRRQHREILRLTTEIAPLLDAHSLAVDASTMRRLLSTLAGTLAVHFSMEDRVMYPKLFAHPDITVSSIARRYAEDMGNIRDLFIEYFKRWATPEAIQQDSGTFIRDTSRLFSSLTRRVAREDTELYPIVDMVGLG